MEWGISLSKWVVFISAIEVVASVASFGLIAQLILHGTRALSNASVGVILGVSLAFFLVLIASIAVFIFVINFFTEASEYKLRGRIPLVIAGISLPLVSFMFPPLAVLPLGLGIYAWTRFRKERVL